MNKFPWGTVLRKIPVLDEYIVEYEVGGSFADAGNIEYSYAEESYETLDQALLGFVCARIGSIDDMPYVARVLGVKYD